MTKALTFVCTLVFVTILWGVTAPAYADTYYDVQPGDTLWQISKLHGISVEQIQTSNSLNSTMIHPGQKLLITGSAPAAQPITVSRGTSRAEMVIDYARTLIGAPYAYRGQSPAGFDCSGYVQYVFKNFGVDMPRTASEQFNIGTKVNSSEARPGDIVAFASGGAINHTGIYLGGGSFISSTSSHGVDIAPVFGSYWANHFYGFSRIIP
ncbi:LysM domain-containing protein [Desulfotomaculum arcticum]|uniref:LysM domain-containing protein n=1 Tax=Desulfotruncus arcticus DSM 17038 TaxID=1121424 RepID=A0A1I2YI59_9FIRM|nr:LysM peptidoglycan-binding domain-containing C40 family peptidase [Desulfotruncus arcticus]SFH25147.1 LysM domain-containing protein [Desulfotomaculum arcticum] [Desulfotruncus arcticus DSM 17038]